MGRVVDGVAYTCTLYMYIEQQVRRMMYHFVEMGRVMEGGVDGLTGGAVYRVEGSVWVDVRKCGQWIRVVGGC